MTKSIAMELLNKLHERFSSSDFQSELKLLEKEHSTCAGVIVASSADFLQERQELFLTVQAQVLPQYGFEGTVVGVHHMIGAMSPFIKDDDFLDLATKVNTLLGINLPP